MRIDEIAHRPSHRAHSGHHQRRTDADERASHAAFKPHLRCECERDTPQPIFIAAMIGVSNLRTVPVPDLTWTLPEGERDKIVKAAILQHFHRTGGRSAAFGRILRYSLVIAPSKDGTDLAVPYDLEGNPAGPLRHVPRLGHASLSVDGQELS